MIDSHTGDPDLGTGPLSERLGRFRGQHDSFLSAVAHEPRGSDVRVMVLLCAPADPDCAADVIFFNFNDGGLPERESGGRSELFGQSDLPAVDSKNFVLYPGKAHDRSACGAGTSAQRACLDADGKIREGQIWKQESIVGSVFEGSITASGGQVYPSLKGTAFVNSEAELLPDPQDPFCMGIRG